MSNIQKWKVMTWDYGMSRYVQEYITEFEDTWRNNEVLEEVLRCDQNLPAFRTPFDTCETIVVRHKKG